MPKCISLDDWQKERNRRFIDAKKRLMHLLLDCYVDENGNMKFTQNAFDALVDLFEAVSGTFDWEQ